MWASTPHQTSTANEFARLDYSAGGADGARLLVSLHDDLDVTVAGLLHDTLEKVTAMPPCAVTIDLAEVRYLFSAGLSFLALLNNHVTAAGHTVTLLNAAPVVRRVLHICGFDKAMTIAD